MADLSDAIFRPVRAGNAFEETVGRLLQTIRLGMIAPGEALPPERDLAVRFSVSRDTVRDAIRSLSDAGFLVSRRGRYGGTFVVEVLPARAPTELEGRDGATAQDLDDVLALRDILEVGAVRAAAARTLTAADRELLWSRYQEVSGSTVDDYRRIDSRLHLGIGELAGSPSLVPLLADNRTRVNAFLDGIPLLPPNIEHSNEQHEAIVIAILTGDVERAATAMQEHLDGSAALLRAFLA
ncbi:FCD domain-containing protein [soil metagenome]